MLAGACTVQAREDGRDSAMFGKVRVMIMTGVPVVIWDGGITDGRITGRRFNLYPVVTGKK